METAKTTTNETEYFWQPNNIRSRETIDAAAQSKGSLGKIIIIYDDDNK
jgi:hypothetical protein